MTLKQRICGFIGHKSKIFEAWNGDVISHVRFICQRCGFKSRWFLIKEGGPAYVNDLIKVNAMVKMNTLDVENKYLKKSISNFRLQLLGFCESIEQEGNVEYTGWYVLLKKDGNAFTCLGIFNPDVCEYTEPEWDLCLPIPDTDTYKEFVGW